MKKFAAISLLVVLLFNIAGYRLFFYYLLAKADARIESKIDKLYAADDRLTTLKIPINLPYQTDWKYFEPASGEVTYKGITYKYVKQKVYRDTLILLCINHREKTELQKGSDEYFRKVNDLSQKDPKKPVLKIAKIDFYETLSCYVFSKAPTAKALYKWFNGKNPTAAYVEESADPPENIG